ncbi:MAG: aspartate ammonia-lyase [Sphaerochaetaceae bacterium]|nr:aspartate ammonia-lyase [Sphaerochaetaceae bacterium]
MRKEKDGLGEKQVELNALYGIHSLRAKENFPISERKADCLFIDNIARVKKACAMVNGKNGDLKKETADAIIHACDEILEGSHYDSFIVDPMQGGAGTSYNMNANEVIANLAIISLGGKPGQYSLVHPLDHVNLHQSTNDVIPTAGKITVIRKTEALLSSLERLKEALDKKAEELTSVITLGRTQLQDAVPMQMSQAFQAYSTMTERSIEEIKKSLEPMHKVNMGGTAIGTGINSTPQFFRDITPALSSVTGMKIEHCENLFDGTQNADGFASVSSAVKVCAIKLSKMASDLRLLSSGPDSGFCEIKLPPRQSGSSIMPGKVNPVIPEALNQAAFLVMGHDLTISMAVESGQLELNAFMPVILCEIFEEIDVLSNAVDVFIDKCLRDIKVDKKKCADNALKSKSLATALNPLLGYDESSAIVKKALSTGKTVFEIAVEDYGINEEKLKELLNPVNMTNA